MHNISLLTFKAPITTAADNMFIFFLFIFFFIEKNIHILCESSAKQTIHIKCQYLFSIKNKTKLDSSAF